MRMNPDVKLRGDHNECPSCGMLFNSMAAFDRHRRGYFGTPIADMYPRRCLTQSEMLDAGMAVNRARFWVREKRNAATLPHKK